MTTPPSGEQPAIPAPIPQNNHIDICFISKQGKISVGDSEQFGIQTPAPSAHPSISSRSPTVATAGTGTNVGMTSSAGSSSSTSSHGIQRQTGATSPPNESGRDHTAKTSAPRSNDIEEYSLIPAQFLEHGESPVATKPKDSYFTLIWLDRFYEVKPAPNSEGNDEHGPYLSKKQTSKKQTSKKELNLNDFKEMDNSYAMVLDSLGLCGDCKKQAREILWRNIGEYESRYESRCRICDDNNSVCFLQFHTMQAPYLNESNFILALVHHIKMPKTPLEQNQRGGYGDSEEHIFAFVLGLKAEDIGKLFSSLRLYWEGTNSNLKEVGLTTRLFLTATLKVYGFREAQKSVREAFGKLEMIYEGLIDLKGELEVDAESGKAVPPTAEGKKAALTEDEEMRNWKDKYYRQMKKCTSLHLKLMQMDKVLPGVRSRAHFVGLCAQGLLRDESHMHQYIKDHLESLREENAERVAARTQLIEALDLSNIAANGKGSQRGRGKSVDQVIKELSSSRYKRRDDDKLDMLNRSMQQFEIDIKSLKARANIAIGLVATEYARVQGNFQGLIIHATERDGSAMRKMSTLTVLLLPATFLAILFTTPMIQWAKPVVQLASDTPDFGVDRGKPILVIIPFSLWIGLSFIVSFLLWARLKAQRAQQKTPTWLFEQAGKLMGQTKTILTRSMKRLLGKSKGKSRTWQMEAAQNQTPEAPLPTAPSNKTDKENLQEQTPHVSRISGGNRRSGESTLPPGSAVDGTEGTELGHNTPSIS